MSIIGRVVLVRTADKTRLWRGREGEYLQIKKRTARKGSGKRQRVAADLSG